MNRDPFLRLALIALGSLYALGIAVIEHFYGGPLAAVVLLGGFATAGVVSIVLEPPKPDTDRRRRQRQPAEGTRGFERLE